MSFILANTVNPNKVFLIRKSELEKRLDPAYYYEIKNNKLNYSHPVKTISKIVKSYTGGTPDKSNLSYWNGNIFWASPKDMKEFYLTTTEDRITDDAVENSSTSIAPKESVIIVFRSGILQHTLPVVISKIETVINQDLKVLVPSEEIIPEYLATFLKTFEKRILPRIVKHSTTVQSINQEEFDKLQIPIPSKSLQEKIILINQKAIEQKKINEAAVEKLLISIDDYLLNELGITLPAPPDNILKNRIYKTSLNEISGKRFDPYYFSEHFNEIESSIRKGKFSYTTISSIAFTDTGRTPARNAYVDEATENKIPIVKAGSYTDDFIDLSKCDFTHSEFQGNEIYEGDIFILGAAHQAEYVGKKVYYLNQGPTSKTFFVGELVRISTDKTKFDSSLLFSILKTKVYSLLLNREKRGQTSHLYPDDVKHILIPVPPLPKQKEIASHITSIRKQAQTLKDKTKKSLKKASEEIETILLG